MSDIADANALRVSALAAEDVVRIDAAANMFDVADALAASEIGILVIERGDAVAAVVSERDLARALAARRDPVTTRAIDIGSSNIVWCDVTSTIGEVANEMMSRYVRHVLVEDNGRLVGVVSARDLLGAYAAADAVAADDGWD